MPNHVINEVRFEAVAERDVERIRKAVLDAKGDVSFDVLLPVPLNYWLGSVGAKHQKAFPGNALDWCSANWGTKWGPYGNPTLTVEGQTVTIRFKTAWNTPRGWLCALLNTINKSFIVEWLSEGESGGYVETFSFQPEDKWSSFEWEQRSATQQETNRLGVLLWGEAAWNEINTAGAA